MHTLKSGFAMSLLVGSTLLAWSSAANADPLAAPAWGTYERGYLTSSAWTPVSLPNLRPAASADASADRPIPLTLQEPVSSIAHHSAYVELGGAGLVYSINYEYRVGEHLGIHGGVGVFPLCMFGSCRTVPMVPLSIRGLIGNGAHKIEVGGGVSLGLIDDKDARFFVPEIGYRYSPPEGGVLVRLTFTPMVRVHDPQDILPWGGASVGYSW